MKRDYLRPLAVTKSTRIRTMLLAGSSTPAPGVPGTPGVNDDKNAVPGGQLVRERSSLD